MNKKEIRKKGTEYTVSVFTKILSISRYFRLCHFTALAQNKLRIAIVNTYSNCLFWIIINRAATIQKPIQKFSVIYQDHLWKYRAVWLMIAIRCYLTKTYFRPIGSPQKSNQPIKTWSELSEMNGILECFERFV